MAKGGSKVLTSIIAFLLGFLFAIIIEVGAVAGVGLYIYNAKIDDAFAFFGVANDDQSDSHRQYINTDTENGGVETVASLITKLGDMYNNLDSQTLATLEELFPALEGVTDQVYDGLSDYVELDKAELKSQTISTIAEYISNQVYSIQVSTILTKTGNDSLLDHEGDNKIVAALLEGTEAKYVTVGTSKYLVYYDEYTMSNSGDADVYTRTSTVNGTAAYPSGLSAEEWITETSHKNDSGEKLYRQYYYKAGDAYYVTKKVDDEFISSNVAYSSDYATSDSTKLSGNFYYNENGEKKIVTPVTIKSLTSNPFDSLNEFAISDLLTGDIVKSIFGDTSLGDLIKGNVEMDGLVDDLKLITIVDVDPESPIMMYIGYNVTGVTKTGENTYTGTYNGTTAVTITSEVNSDGDTVVKKVVNTETGAEIGGVTVDEISDIVDGAMDALAVADLMDIDPESPIMMYIGYNITGVTKTSENASTGEITYTGTYNKGGTDEKVVTITAKTEDGKTTVSSIKDASGNELIGVTINGISGVVDGAMDALTIPDLMDIDPESPIMMYIGYKVSDIVKVNDTTYTGIYDKDGANTAVTITVETSGEKTIVKSIVDANGKEVSGVTINGISDVVDNATKVLTIADMMDIDATSNIMVYIAYGMTDVFTAPEGADYAYTATVNGATVYVYVDSSSNITKVTDVNGAAISGTTIDGIGDKVSNITKDLALSDIIDIEPTTFNDDGSYKDNNNIMAFLAFSITDVAKQADGTLTAMYHIYTTDSDGNDVDTAFACTLNISDGKIVNVTYLDGTTKVIGNKTKIDDISKQINHLTATLKIGDIINIDPEDKVMVKLGQYSMDNVSDAIDTFEINDFMEISGDSTIMMYIGYGVYGIEEVAAEDVDNAYITVDGASVAYKYTGHMAVGYEGKQADDPVSYIVVNGENKVVGVYIIKDGETTVVEGTTVKEISNRVDSLTKTLTLNELITGIDESNKVLYALRNSTVDGLSDAIKTLTIQELFPDDVYGDNAKYVAVTATRYEDIDQALIYYVLVDGEYVYVNNNVENEVRGKLSATSFNADTTYYVYMGLAKANLKSADDIVADTTYYVYNSATEEYEVVEDIATSFNADTVYYVYKTGAKGTWKFMLYSNDKEQLYTVNDIGTLMKNTTNNIKTATVSDLRDADIVSEDIDVWVPIYKDETNKTFTIKAADDCTIDELISSIRYLATTDYANAMIGVDSNRYTFVNTDGVAVDKNGEVTNN